MLFTAETLSFKIKPMLVWLLVIGLFVVFGAIGYSKGAIRMLVSFVGFVLAFYLATPLSPLAAKLLPSLEITHPISKALVPPLIAFAVVNLVFIGISFYIHRLVELHFKYKTDDMHFEAWRRMNGRLGVFIGFVTATVYTVAIGLFVYIGGYLTVQVAAGDNDPSWLKSLNQARSELKSSGLDRTVALFDHTPAKFYQTADLIGLIYNNPLVWGRMGTYPQFLSLTERQDVQEISADTEFLTLLQSQAPLTDILNHARTQALLENQELRTLIDQVDLKDLSDFLQTGKTSKFEDMKILGNWRMEPAAVVTMAKRTKQDITPAQMIQVKRLATTILSGVTLKAGADNQLFVKMQLSDEAKKAMKAAADATAAAQQAAAQAPTTDPTRNPEMARRYGLARPGTATPLAGAAPAPAAAETKEKAKTLADYRFTGKGTWSETDGKYKINFNNEGGKAQELSATIENDRLIIPRDGIVLVFVRD